MAVHSKGDIGCKVCDKCMWQGLGGRASWQRVRISGALSLPRQGMKPNLGSELHGCVTQVKPYTLSTLNYSPCQINFVFAWQ